MYHSSTILLVDDEPLILETYQSFLEKEGYSVLFANSPESALQHIEKSSFDLLICDVLLGGTFDGFDLLEIARARKPLLASILITGHPQREAEIRAKKIGSLYLAKPVGFDCLLRAIQSMLDKSELTNTRESNLS